LHYVPSGYEGDYTAISMPNDPTCGGNRAVAGAIGSCHPVTYTPVTPGTMLGNGTSAQGWAGVVWQFPANNWGAMPGYAIPAGATKVTFYAKGAAGGEVIAFNAAGFGVGNIPSASDPCSDTIAGTLPKQTLTTTWTQYTIPLQYPNPAVMSYSGGVLNGFTFVLATGDQVGGGGDGGPPVKFFVDDIQWSK
jgi:hypothetical protein